VFREYIRWIALTVDFAEVDALCPHRLLDPKRVCIEVSELTETLSGTNPDCGAGVSPHAQGQLDADVLE
jgi:hypothetical protein